MKDLNCIFDKHKMSYKGFRFIFKHKSSKAFWMLSLLSALYCLNSKKQSDFQEIFLAKILICLRMCCSNSHKFKKTFKHWNYKYQIHFCFPVSVCERLWDTCNWGKCSKRNVFVFIHRWLRWCPQQHFEFV